MGINQIEKRNETQATYQQSNHLSATGINSDTDCNSVKDKPLSFKLYKQRAFSPLTRTTLSP